MAVEASDNANDDDEDDDDDDDDGGDAQVDDEATALRVGRDGGGDNDDGDASDADDGERVERASNKLNMSEAEIDAELDALLGVPESDAAAKAARSASRSVGASRDWAAKSRGDLERSFRELQERVGDAAAPAPELNKAIVETQLTELRALRDAYAAPVLVVGDAVPLRFAVRIDGEQACELAGRSADLAARDGALPPANLCVTVLLPISYPRASAEVTTFWALPPADGSDSTNVRNERRNRVRWLTALRSGRCRSWAAICARCAKSRAARRCCTS